MRAEPVPWFGLFFSWITMLLGIEDPKRRHVKIEFLPGDLESVAAVARGDAEIGMTTPPVCATMARRGVGPFREPAENLRAILSFPHDDRLVWAVPAEWGIDSISQLKDRKLSISFGADDGPVGFAVRKVLEACGISLDEQAASGRWTVLQEEYLFKVITHGIAGRADVVIHEGRKTPPWSRLGQTRKLAFLPIPEPVLAQMERDYGFRPAVLSKGMMDGTVLRDTPTLDWSEWLLFARDDVDEDLVWLITKIVVEYRHLFEMSFRGQPLEKSDLVYPMVPAELWKNVGVPLHAGAERYYRDHGHLN
jgi:hypothetical protein